MNWPRYWSYRPGAWATEAGTLHVQNGGKHPAIDVTLDCLAEEGKVYASGRVAVVQAATEEEVLVRLGSVETRQAFASSHTVIARWSDGLGPRDETLTVLPVR
jgi:hypothetical protein